MREIPLLVLDDLSQLPDTPGDAVVRRLAPEEVSVHVEVAAAGYGVPEEYFWRLMAPGVFSARGMRCYVVEVGDRAVATGCGVTLGDRVGVFNVATLPTESRRGYGTLATVEALRHGRGAGAEWAFLQSSPAGQRVYERLGFRTVERWPCWIAEPSS